MPKAAAVPFVSVAQLTRAMARKTPIPQSATILFSVILPITSRIFELTQGYAVAENVDESADAGHHEEASVLQSRRVPTGGDGVNVESLLRQLRSILSENNGSARLEEGEGYDGPEDPGQLKDLFGLELLGLLRQFLSSCRVRDVAKLLVCDSVEPVEDQGEGIGENVHKHRDPKDPRKVAGVLGDDVGRRLANEPANLLDAKLDTQGRSEAVVGREPGAEDLVLGHLGCDVTEGEDDPSTDHQLERADLSCGGDDDGTDGVDDVSCHRVSLCSPSGPSISCSGRLYTPYNIAPAPPILSVKIPLERINSVTMKSSLASSSENCLLLISNSFLRVDFRAPVMPELHDEPKLMQEISKTAMNFQYSGGCGFASSVDNESGGKGTSLMRSSGSFLRSCSTSSMVAMIAKVTDRSVTAKYKGQRE